MSTAGKLSFGSSTTALATLDASGLSGNVTLTVPATGGTVLTSGTTVTPAQGGTGVANTATFTLGSANINYATLGTGIIKNTTTTGAHTLAAYADVVSLWASGSCSGYLKNDGTCSSGTGSTAFSAITGPSTNSTAGNMTLQTGANFIFDYEGIGTTSTDGILMENLTAATSGSTQQYSPRVHWTGQGWKSNSTATNQQVEAFAELEPRSQGAAAESVLAFKAILNGSLASGGIGFCNGGSAAVSGGTFITGLDGGIMSCDNNAGFSGFGPVNAVSEFGVYTNSSERENFTNYGIGFNSTTGLYWASSTIGNQGPVNVGISYSSSGVLGVDSTALNNGNGNLKAGSFLPSGPINWNGDAAPLALTAGTPTSGGSCTAGTHSYKVTFVNQFGETTPGAASVTITCVTSTGQTVPLSAIPLGPSGTTGRNIYRTVAGNTGSYLLDCAASPCIGDNTTTTYSDAVADASLGAAAPSSNTTAGLITQVSGTTVMTGTPSNLTIPAGVTLTIAGESANAGTLACYRTNGTLGYATMSGGNISACN
jgi:hypothetical protein